MSQKFCSILIYASLQQLYHMSKAVVAMVDSIMAVSVLTQCAVLHHTNECVMKSNSGTYALQVQTWP